MNKPSGPDPFEYPDTAGYPDGMGFLDEGTAPHANPAGDAVERDIADLLDADPE